MATALNIETQRRGLYYGWVMVGALAIAATIAYGVLEYAFTVFIKPMNAELGWTTGQLSGAFSLAHLVSAGVGLLIGRLLDGRGARQIMSVGTVAAAGLLFAWSSVTKLEAFTLMIFALNGITVTVFYQPAFWVVANWFSRKRRRALTLLTFIGGFASVIFTPLTQALVNGFGWRTTLVVYGGLLLTVNLPLVALLLRRRPVDLGLQIDGDPAVEIDADPAEIVSQRPQTGLTVAEAIRTPSYWWLTAAFACCGIANGFVIIHFVPYLIEREYSSTFAASMYALIGALSLPGRLILTPLGERIAPGWLAAGMFGLQTLGLVLLITVCGDFAIVGFLIPFAAGYGAISPARAALMAELFGTRHYGALSSVSGLVLTGVTALALTGLAALHDIFGSYTVPFWLLVVASAGGTVCMIVAWVGHQKIGLESKNVL